MMKKSTEGFTLIELLVGILCAALITGAAGSLLLMGARTNRTLLDSSSDLQTSRIVFSLVESLANEGDIASVEFLGTESANASFDHQGWILKSKSGSGILSFSAADQTICTGDGAVLMDEVLSSTLTLSRAPLGGSLLEFDLQTEEGTYSTSAYSRSSDFALNVELTEVDTSSDSVVSPEITDSPSEDGRYNFLSILLSQYGSGGQILGTNLADHVYYTEWYLNDPDYLLNEDWDENTPWCACFVSWAVAVLNSGSTKYLNTVPRFANVNTGWNSDSFTTIPRNEHAPSPGDLIFFDWGSGSPDGLDHVGVVFAVVGGDIYTIEGNSGNKVAVRKYLASDPSIHGYAVLKWADLPT